jgi:hypothetical protein
MQTNIVFGHISLNYSRMRNISSKSCRENQNTNCMFKNFFPPPKNLAVFYEIMWKNIVDPDDNMV